jgi:uncharacterized protein (DUF924 family)
MPSPATCRLADLDEQIAAQHAVIERFEAALWDGGFQENLLASYQAAWRRLEALIEKQGEDRRHYFVIIIPVADSPIHLRDCLASLLELCRAYGYGGQDAQHRWRKVSVLLADDSSEPGCIKQNRAIASEFDATGLITQYFGREEQLALMDRLVGVELAGIVGEHARDAFGHKGQAMMRNIAYLKCAGMAEKRVLFYTVDADQEFKVKVATPDGGRDVYAVNFLYHLDDIFCRTDAQVLTGKVVGDPPVSPAVMAGNFLEDVIGFLREMAVAEPDQPYRQPGQAGSGDAAYHDMADLFGFQPADAAYRYRCAVVGEPDNAACFADFSTRLNRFFHGEHPTRVTWYEHADAMQSVTPARTVYTGNYVFRPEALNWFIPYAPLRLRMSGPTMGRLLQAELGARFVSANLPMLHKRTLEATGQSEFRPGVRDEMASPVIDLCGEFERQFHGDVMLFSMQRLTALGYPGEALAEALVNETLCAMQSEMREKYRAKQHAILERLELLKTLLNCPTNWWNQMPELANALVNFQTFAGNIEHNFGVSSPCYARIDAPGNWESWRTRQSTAITGFQMSRAVWAEALKVMVQERAIHDVLAYWYSPRVSQRWFASTPELDDEIRARYEALWRRAAAGELDSWAATPEGALALAIVLDQLPLNMYRGQPAAFASEKKAVAIARQAIARGDDQRLPRSWVLFLYMPLMHSENLTDQDQSVDSFHRAGLANNLRFAEHHRGLIRRFGRFPHRNAILGRDSTPEELAYLASPEAFKG